jgi:hypothetical protein
VVAVALGVGIVVAMEALVEAEAAPEVLLEVADPD